MTYRAKTFLVQLFFSFLSWVPLRMVHAAGAALGALLAHVPNRRRNTVLVNLALCYPDLTERERVQLMRRNLIEYGRAFAETATLWTRPPAALAALVREVHGEEHLRTALESGRGVILAMPHLGSWEMVNLYCSLRYPLTTLYRAPRLGGLDRLMRAGRERLGAQLVAADASGVRALHDALARGRVVALLPDQVPQHRRSGEFAPFFGIPSLTPVLLSRLARRHDAAVIVAHAARLPAGRGFCLHFRPAPAGISGDSVEQSVALLNSAIEQQVRTLPEQYQWCYKRFRARESSRPCYYALGPARIADAQHPRAKRAA